MLIISFAWTTPALLSGYKTCTRRNWKHQYAARFREGIFCQGYNKLPRIGGKPVTIIQLTRDAYLERTSLMPDSDYEAEGLAWMERQGLKIQGIEPRSFFDRWRYLDELVYVVRFRLVRLIDAARAV